MQRLNQENRNTSVEYDHIFESRQKKGINWADLRRWRMLLKYYKGNSLIDLGTLDSQAPILAHKRYPQADLWAIDISEKAIKEMQRMHPAINYKIMDLYQTQFSESQFDYAILGEILEHLERPENAIKEAMRILKPNGILALSTPLEESKEPGAVDGIHHLWSFRAQDIKRMLEPFGQVKIKIIKSQWFPRYRYCWSQIIAWCFKK